MSAGFAPNSTLFQIVRPLVEAAMGTQGVNLAGSEFATTLVSSCLLTPDSRNSPVNPQYR